MAKQSEVFGNTKIKLSKQDRVFYAIVYTIVTVMTVSVLYPVLYVLACSFSSPNAVGSGQVYLWPVEFSVKGYQLVFGYSDVWIGYRNTIFYTICCTVNNLIFTMMPAFAMSGPRIPGYKGFTVFFLISMYFGGGLIPTYLLYKDIGYVNTIWAIIVPGAFSVYQMIVCRTFMNSNIPLEMIEATKIDGCSDVRFFIQFVLPLSKAILAVMTLNFAVGQWNSYFAAHIYLQDSNLYPLQSFLRKILVLGQLSEDQYMDPEEHEKLRGMSDLLKYALIVVATAPIMCVYPFIQKYFVQGIMIGSLKG